MIIDEEEYKDHEAFCLDYIKNNCLLRGVFPSKNENFKLSYMFYLKSSFYNAQFLTRCCKMLLLKIQNTLQNFDFQLTGMETGAIPLLIGLNLVSNSFGVNINTFSVRKTKKTYGLFNRIDGTPNGKKILIVDDIMNTGSSNRTCRTYLEEENLNSVYDYNVSVLCKSPKPTDIYLFKWDAIL